MCDQGRFYLATLSHGYDAQGSCDHLFDTGQLEGSVAFVTDYAAKVIVQL